MMDSAYAWQPTLLTVVSVHGYEDIFDNQLQEKDVEYEGACAIDCQLRWLPREHCWIGAAGQGKSQV